jgi:hypothetical protein
MVRTTIPNPDDPRPGDAVNRCFTAAGPNRLWVTDLTVIATGEGPLWLASIHDAFSRKVIACETSEVADADPVCAVLEYALRSRRPPSDGSLVHHAPRGSAPRSFRRIAERARRSRRPTLDRGPPGDQKVTPLSTFWRGQTVVAGEGGHGWPRCACRARLSGRFSADRSERLSRLRPVFTEPSEVVCVSC